MVYYGKAELLLRVKSGREIRSVVDTFVTDLAGIEMGDQLDRNNGRDLQMRGNEQSDQATQLPGSDRDPHITRALNFNPVCRKSFRKRTR